MDFTNEAISITNLPQYQEVPLIPIEKKYKRVIIWTWVFGSLVLAGIALVFFLVDYFFPYRWIATASVSLLSVVWIVLELKAFGRRSYAIRKHDVIYRHGIISIQTTVIPFRRIQHVAVNEGVLSRIYGLAAIQIFTAGGSSDDLKISGLKKKIAEQLRELILEKITK